MSTPRVDVIAPPSLVDLYNGRNDLVSYHSDVLRQVASPVEEGTNVDDLIVKMQEAMKEFAGVGLAAPQVGESLRVIVLAFKPFVIINPQVVKFAKDSRLGEEGCLSMPELRGKVARHSHIFIKGYSSQWDEIEVDFRDFSAAVVQHEIDHLNGVLFTDKAIPETLYFRNL